MSWPQLIFGWPTIILAVVAFGVAFAREGSGLGFIGLALATPFLWYTSHAPRGLWFSALLFVALGTAALLLRRGQRRWAAAGLAPFIVIVLILAAAVATQR